MITINKNDLLQLEILKHVEKTPLMTNRIIADKLGVSVKLAHELLKGMTSRGLLHVKKLHSRRWDYFLTPSGLKEKLRLTREFMSFSMQFYHEARKKSSQICRDLAEADKKDVVFLGTGELAEIAYLGVKEWGLNLTEVYGEAKGSFLGRQVLPASELEKSTADAIIVCLYDASEPMAAKYLPPAITEQSNMHWIF